MPVRGLTILVATGDAERLHAALTFGAAGAATGATVRLHLHEGAVALLRVPMAAPFDEERHQAGLPTLSQIFAEAVGIGVAITVCQSGLALARMSLDDLGDGIEAQGPIGLLSMLGDDHFLVF